MRVMMQAKSQGMMMLVFAAFFFSILFFTFKASGYGRFKRLL